MRLAIAMLIIGLAAGTAGAQLARRDGAPEPVAQPHRTRLILKDGTYQMVTSYKVAGTRVKYTSAERGGAAEEIPLALVDLPATQRWEADHSPAAAGESARPAPAIDPELLKAEADRAALTPEVATNLRLPQEDSVLALDTYRNSPELVPLAQSQTDLNKQTGHNVLKAIVNPRAAAHQISVLKGEKADVQMHVDKPEFYVRLDDEAAEGGGDALVVDTHGASSSGGHGKKGPPNPYVVVRMDVRQDARVVPSVNTALLDGGGRQEDVVETASTVLPGSHWMKLVPRESLLTGEYALVEILGDRAINLGVWDFGVHPTAPENRDALLPETPRRPGLEKRPRP